MFLVISKDNKPNNTISNDCPALFSTATRLRASTNHAYALREATILQEASNRPVFSVDNKLNFAN